METDVIIIGCGPSGIQAAIHASRRKASVIVVGKPSNSAIAGAELDNYFGTGTVSGDDILSLGISQAESTGAQFIHENVISASTDGSSFSFVLDSGTEVTAKSVVLAMGVSRHKLGVPGENELYGKGVSYCAVCDCNFYRGRRTVIVGNESEAAVSAEMMTKYASETSWVVWEDGVNQRLSDAAVAAGVKVYRSKPVSIDGEGKVESITLEDGTVIQTDGVFIELGAKSAADIAMDIGVMPEMDDSIKVSAGCSTEVAGVFACGDIVGKPYQVAKAVGEGCVAGTSASVFVRESK
jgi:thioredoxin reductase (NADPH)